ncbi:MAG: PAS domain-containing protein [Deltaproteobacteria bacterium]|nr:PAS domain-containing protein [Deltaproteobacteria bacterium]
MTQAPSIDLLQRLGELVAQRDSLEREIEKIRRAIALGPTSNDRWSESPPVATARIQGDSSSTTSPYQQALRQAENLLRVGNPAVFLQQVQPEPARVESRVAPLAVEDRASFDLGRVRQLRTEELDSLPYGLIVLDSEGRVLSYNDAESRMAKLRREQVIGKNFFSDVAPCTRVREFEGRFRAFVRSGGARMLETFDFVFRFAHGTQHVTIFIVPGRVRGTFNVAMTRRAIEPNAVP